MKESAEYLLAKQLERIAQHPLTVWTALKQMSPGERQALTALVARADKITQRLAAERASEQASEVV